MNFVNSVLENYCFLTNLCLDFDSYLDFIRSGILFIEIWWVFIITLIIFLRLYFQYFNIKNMKLLIYIVLFGLVFRFIFLLYLLTPCFLLDNSLIVLNLLNNDVVINETLFNVSFFGLVIEIFISFLLIIFFLILLNSFNNIFDNYINYEVLIILLISLDALFLIIYCNDLMLLYFLLELLSLSIYILVGLKRYSNIAVRSSIYFFIFGSIASSILLLGISFIYFTLNVTNISSLYTYLYLNSINNVDLPYLVYFGLILILIGLFFKLGIAPFHFWVSDVYEGASTIITCFISIFPKIAYLYLLLNTFSFIFNPSFLIIPYSFKFLNLILLCVYLSIILGTFGAFYQTRIKRLLAYSSIVNIGFIVLSLSLGSVFGLFGSIYTLVIYLIGLIHLFAIIIFTKYYNSEYSDSQLSFLVDLRSITHSNYILAIVLVTIFFSLSGLPPFIGFFGKWFIIKALIMENYFMITVFFILFNVFLSVYYIRLIRMLVFGDSQRFPISFNYCLSVVQANIISILTCFYILLFFFQGFFIDFFYMFYGDNPSSSMDLINNVSIAHLNVTNELLQAEYDLIIDVCEGIIIQQDILTFEFFQQPEMVEWLTKFLFEHYSNHPLKTYNIYCTQDVYWNIIDGRDFILEPKLAEDIILTKNLPDVSKDVFVANIDLINNINHIISFNQMDTFNGRDTFIIYDIVTLEELGRYNTLQLQSFYKFSIMLKENWDVIQHICDDMSRKNMKIAFLKEVFKLNPDLAWTLYTSDVMLNGPLYRHDLTNVDIESWGKLKEKWILFHEFSMVSLRSDYIKNWNEILISFHVLKRQYDFTQPAGFELSYIVTDQFKNIIDVSNIHNNNLLSVIADTFNNLTQEQLVLLENNKKLTNLMQYSLSNPNTLELILNTQINSYNTLLEVAALDSNLQIELSKFKDTSDMFMWKEYLDSTCSYHILTDEQYINSIYYHNVIWENFWSRGMFENDDIVGWQYLIFDDFEKLIT